MNSKPTTVPRSLAARLPQPAHDTAGTTYSGPVTTLTVSRTDRGSRPVTTVRVDGEVDMSSHALFARVGVPDVGSIVVDLAGVTFCDLVGLELLRGWIHGGFQQADSCVVVGTPPQLRRVVALERAVRGARPGASEQI